MNESLGKYLEKIGQELSNQTICGDDGVIHPITKDEQLARAIWDQALGCDVVTVNVDGHESHKIFPPDPKMMQFIIERREGKLTTPIDKKQANLLDRISDLNRSKANDAARQATNDSNETQEN